MGKHMSRLATVVCMLLMISASRNVVAQQITGSIRGTVLDPSGAIVQAARITAKQVETGLTRVVVADHQGDYVVVELPIGHYQLEVQAQGFQTYLQQGISLDVNETATVSVHLKVGSETQQVKVTADRP
jgi:Carboxypeptidase regulatory-like domain